jgi:NlpC/P60 family/FlgD Ig-like domain
VAGLATLVALTYVTAIAITPASAADVPDIRSASVAPRVFDPLAHDGRRDRTTFAFTITGSGNVRIDVLTHSRRIIRTRRFGVLPAGGYRWRWNGRKSSGAMAPQGRYVIRLTTGAGSTTAAVTRKVVLASPLLTTRTIDRAALRQTGKPYVWGATGPASFDCSGLTQWSYRMAGIRLPRTSFEQYRRGRPLSRGSIRPGDLVFYDTGGPGPSHVGIAVTSTTFVSATAHGVRTTEIGGPFWGAHYVGARRIVTPTI